MEFLGVTDVTVIRAEGLAFGPDARKQAIERALAELELLSGELA
jgi:FMN-dependent NADH-azoreductase